MQQFPVDTLKIDRSFISGMYGDPEVLEIVKVIVALAHNLGMEVVAEGIEEQDQMATLKTLGCELGQGYLFSKPADASAMQRFLAARHPAVYARSMVATVGS